MRSSGDRLCGLSVSNQNWDEDSQEGDIPEDRLAWHLSLFGRIISFGHIP